MRSLGRRRAFIAAPLVGTLVFLVCLMLVVAINRSESQRVDEIVSQAYHNRLVSLVEIFRSDLASNFNTGLQRTIEYRLTSQCWFNFAPLHTEATAPDPADPQKLNTYSVISLVGTRQATLRDLTDGLDGPSAALPGIVNETFERYDVCRRMKDLVNTVVCPSDPGNIYGLPSWVKTFATETTFEGVKFSLANPQSEFIPDPARPGHDGLSVCKALADYSSFDCRQFAAPQPDPAHPSAPLTRFKCCKQGTANAYGDCRPEDWESGSCENGFLLPLNVENPNVYPFLPRIQAEDSAGNVIRAGAIADRNFSASITYPLFKYLDAAFVFNRHLAYGANGQKDATVTRKQGVLRGIVQGACDGNPVGGAQGCPVLSDFQPQLPVGAYYRVDAGADPLPMQADAGKSFYAKDASQPGPVLAACREVAQTPYSLETDFCKTGQPQDCFKNYNPAAPDSPFLFDPADSNAVKCLGTGDYNPDLTADPNTIVHTFNIRPSTCGSPSSGSNPLFCAFINPVEALMVFVDTDPARQVDPLAKNLFCWKSVSMPLAPYPRGN